MTKRNGKQQILEKIMGLSEKSEPESIGLAGEIALQALEYLAGNEEELGQFLSLSGLGVDDLRENAGTHEFQAGVLDYFMHNESALVSFCAQKQLPPERVARAAHVLNPTEEM